MICPICGAEKCRESRQCPRHNDTAVCVQCCERCEDYRSKTNYFVCENVCRYYLNHPQVDHHAEVYKISRQITTLEEKANYYYGRGWSRSADKLIAEAGRLKAKRRDYEKIQKDRRRAAGPD